MEDDTIVEDSAETTCRGGDVIATSLADTNYLAGCQSVGLIDRGSKTFVDVDGRGATAVDGLYAAGRVAGTHHQAILAAGDGATVGLSVVEESEIPFSHDWVGPKGYFTDRDRRCRRAERIEEAERREREEASLAAITEAVDGAHPDDPTPHPSLRE